jgi:carboxyl-terminal processing protease
LAKEVEVMEPGGIGLAVLQLYDHSRENNHKGPIVVLDVLEKGSAIQAGVERGDIITHIDGKSTSGREFEYILEEMLRGPAYTSVTLTIRRSSTGQTFNMTLDRVVSKGLY